MLQFVVGRSGAGKTAYLKQKLCTLVTKEQADKLLFLVPEQLSFETEKDMLSRLGAKECRKVEVLSFTRLADFVYRQTGGLAGQAIDDGGRHIIMSLAIEQAQDRLELYQKQAGKPELIPLMLNALKELKTCAVSTQRLREAAAGFVNGTLRQKVMETALIVDIYDAILEGSYIDPLDDLTRLYHALSAHTLFDGYTVVVDGFSGFTAQEQKILEVLIRQASLCIISICGDEAEFASDGNLRKKMGCRFCRISGWINRCVFLYRLFPIWKNILSARLRYLIQKRPMALPYIVQTIFTMNVTLLPAPSAALQLSRDIHIKRLP